MQAGNERDEMGENGNTQNAADVAAAAEIAELVFAVASKALSQVGYTASSIPEGMENITEMVMEIITKHRGEGRDETP